MGQNERIFKIQRLLKEKPSVSMDEFVQELEVNKSTVKRDFDLLRDIFQMPIIWDSQLRGYRLEHNNQELPGLWFSEEETYALLAAHQLLAGIEPGILAHCTAPLKKRLQKLLNTTGHSSIEIGKRIKLLPVARRNIPSRHFKTIVSSLLQRRQLNISVWIRSRDNIAERTVSPQRLIYYRDNWYLDTWCHHRGALRSFAVETIQNAQALKTKARDINETQLNEHFGAAYGIFAGKAQHTAVLRFTPERTRWVQFEQWHPEQQSEILSDGSYRLKIPFSDSRELLMDILRHGRHVHIESPAFLKKLAIEEAKLITEQYQK